MSFPRYPSYKDSGVEWLGDVPEHWSLSKIKLIASFSGGGTPSRENLGYWNGGIPWVSPKDMKTERIANSEESISGEGLRNSASNLLPPGRVLMVVRSGILKHTIPVSINEASVALNQDMKALDFDSLRCDARFFLRWVQGHNDQLLLAWAKQGATVESIEQNYLANTVIPLPLLSEQITIAAFLERETVKIDELMVEQQRLIELLKEKRQAVISHAVTKGLNSDAPMKSSGIEWLGDVPEHWDCAPVKSRYNIQLGKMLNEQSATGGNQLPYLRNANVRWDRVDIADVKTMSFSDPERIKFRLRPGDLLVCEGGANIKVVGRTSVWQGEISECYYQKALHRLRASKIDENARFYLYVMQHAVSLGVFIAESNPNTVFHLTMEMLRAHRFPFPPPSEQDDIVGFLDEAIEKLDLIRSEAEQTIGLLQERRTALISAAVTGQIDVRSLVESEAA